jgi:hypothetical protein
MPMGRGASPHTQTILRKGMPRTNLPSHTLRPRPRPHPSQQNRPSFIPCPRLPSAADLRPQGPRPGAAGARSERSGDKSRGARVSGQPPTQPTLRLPRRYPHPRLASCNPPAKTKIVLCSPGLTVARPFRHQSRSPADIHTWLSGSRAQGNAGSVSICMVA